MDVNIKVLRTFVEVIRQGSFSAAARALKTTQPSVSQQIGWLETELKTRLFERVSHDIVPTESAKELYEFAQRFIEQADQFYDAFHSKRQQPKGIVRCAMPESCLWTPYFKIIMSKLTLLPEIQVEVKILSSHDTASELLAGSIDFGFVMGEKISPDLRFERFTDERYSAVATGKEFFVSFQSSPRRPLRLISYPGWELPMATWLKTHGLWKRFGLKLDRPTVHVGTLAGAIHALKAGVGVAVFPTHCIQEELILKELEEFQPTSRVAAVPVFLTTKHGALHPQRNLIVLDNLRRAKIAADDSR